MTIIAVKLVIAVIADIMIVLLEREITSVGMLEFRPPVTVQPTCMVDHILIGHILIRQTFFIFTGLQVMTRKDLRAMLKEKGRDQIW